MAEMISLPLLLHPDLGLALQEYRQWSGYTYVTVNASQCHENKISFPGIAVRGDKVLKIGAALHNSLNV